MSCVDMSASKHLTHDVDNTCCDWHRLLVLWGTHEERNHRSICVTTIASTYVSYKLHIILIWVMPWPSLAHLSLHKHGGGSLWPHPIHITFAWLTSRLLMAHTWLMYSSHVLPPLSTTLPTIHPPYEYTWIQYMSRYPADQVSIYFCRKKTRSFKGGWGKHI